MHSIRRRISTKECFDAQIPRARQGFHPTRRIVETEGLRGNLVYMLGDHYKELNDIKALNIGLQSLM